MKKSQKLPTYYYKTTVSAFDSRIIKSGASEILKAAKKYLNKNPKKVKVLDVGSGEGEFTLELAKHFGKAVGVEPVREADEYAKKHIPKSLKNVKFVHSKIEDYKTSEKYDLVTAITIFEHLANQKKAFDKIFSLLNKGGIIYITAPNKYWIFEQHYGYPFLSWLPLPLANKYVELMTGGKNKSFEDCSYGRSYKYMKSFFNKYPCSYYFIPPFDVNAVYFGCGKKGLYRLMKSLGVFLIKLHPFFWNFSKGFIVVVKKK